MRKLLALLSCLFALLPAFGQNARKLDQPMEIRSCNIKITANAFVAKTFIEIEFYNPQPNEIEGVQYFRLNEGQIINAFQLDLNDKYRDGSIEEKWKANNAYNSIVGKRVDPALLQMTSDNQYRLNIYPFAPRSSRKVTMTIVQILKDEKQSLVYDLPVLLTDTIEKLQVDIDVENNLQIPFINAGLLAGSMFTKAGNQTGLRWVKNNLAWNKNIRFTIPVKEDDYHYYNGGKQGNDGFVLRLFSSVPKYFTSKQNKLAVYWDGSASSFARDIEKEISYLEYYIANHKIYDVDLYVFADKIKLYQQFDLSTQKLSEIRSVISRIKYAGTTNLDAVDLSSIHADVALIFSDGIQTSGTGKFKDAACVVHCITSVSNFNADVLKSLCGNTGGRVIDIQSNLFKKEDRLAVKAENMLSTITSASQKVLVNEGLPIRATNIFVTGQHNNNSPIHLKFGNSISSSKEYSLSPNINFDSTLDSYGIIQLVNGYNKVKAERDWQEVLLFGLENKIVTERTAYIVLERIEDYINYKIAPPKELEEQCAQMNYVYSSQYRRRELKRYSEAQETERLIAGFNKKIDWWNEANAGAIQNVSQVSGINEAANKDVSTKEKNTFGNNAAIQNMTGQNTIGEVVVTSAFGVNRASRTTAASVQHISADQLNMVRQSNINNALAGKVAGIQVRSQSAAALGRETLVRLRGENSLRVGGGVLYVVDGTITPDANDINPDDIEDVTVLQAPAATALFGPDGANGAILVNYKRAKRLYNNWSNRYGKYKLSDMQDVEYLEEMKNTDKDDLLEKYEKLKKGYINNAAFYFDMADLFFEKNMRRQALLIMEDGIEMCNGAEVGKRAAAYQFEKWKEFDKAIKLYKEMLEMNEKNIDAMRELALCYYQNKQYQLALDMYYQGITTESSEYKQGYTANTKQSMISEMNALIANQNNKLDQTNINPSMIVGMPGDIYISVATNWLQHLQLNVVTPSKGSYAIANIADMYWQQKKESKNHYLKDGNLQILKAEEGKYRITQSAYNYHSTSIPIYTRIILFKNFQKANQEIEIQTIQMDNQYGEVEIGNFNW